MNTVAAVLAFLASFSPATTCVTTSTEMLAASDQPTPSALAGGGSNFSTLGYSLAGAAVIAGTVALMNDGGSHHSNIKPVPEPASMLALGLGAAALVRRRKIR